MMQGVLPALALVFAAALDAERTCAVLIPPSTQLDVKAIDGVVREVLTYRAVRAIAPAELAVRGIADPIGKCGSDLECQMDWMRSGGLALGLLINADLEMDPPLVSIALVDADLGRELGKAVREVRDRQTALAVVRETLQSLFDGAGFPVLGRFTLELAPAGAEVAAIEPHDRTISVHPGVAREYKALPGTYRIKVAAEGFEPRETAIEVIARRDARARIELEESPTIFASPWFWIATGAVLAAGTAGAIGIAMSSPSSERKLCVSTRDEGCAP